MSKYPPSIKESPFLKSHPILALPSPSSTSQVPGTLSHHHVAICNPLPEYLCKRCRHWGWTSCCCLWLDILPDKCNKSLRVCCGKMCGSHRPHWLHTGTHLYLLGTLRQSTERAVTPYHDQPPRLFSCAMDLGINILWQQQKDLFPQPLLHSLYFSDSGTWATRRRMPSMYKTTRETQHLILIAHPTWRLGDGDAFWTSPHLKRSCHRPRGEKIQQNPTFPAQPFPCLFLQKSK